MSKLFEFVFNSSPWNSKRAARGEKTRAAGRNRFIFFNGGFCWGGLMLVMMSIIHFIARDLNPATSFFIGLPIWPLTGMLIYWNLWTKSEASYQHYKNEKKEKADEEAPASISELKSRRDAR